MDISFNIGPERRWARAGRTTAAACLLSVGMLPAAQAALTENLMTSAVAMSLGNAVTADPPGIESVHFNPAGLTRVIGDRELHTVTGVSVRTSASFTQPDGFDIGGWTQDPLAGTHTGPVRQAIYVPGVGVPNWRLPGLVVPGLGFSFNQPGSPFTFATMNYLSQGMSVDRTKDPNDPGRFDGRLVQIQRIVYLSPTVGYKVSDTLSVGVGVPIAHAALALNTDLRMPNKLLGIVGKVQEGWCPKNGGNIVDTFTVGLCGGGPDGMLNPFKRVANVNIDMTSPVDPTFNVGVLWEPVDAFALGVVYQGGTKTQYSGRYTFTTDPMVRKFVGGMYSSLFGPIVAAMLGQPTSIPEVQSGKLTASIPFPYHVQVGIKLKPTKALQFNVDASYADWGTWDAMTIQFDQSIKLLEVAHLFGVADATKMVIPRGYRSVLNWGFGVQAQVSDKLTLRAGYEPRKSSVPADKIDLIAPLPDTKLFSVGLNYKLSNDADINLAASYLKGDFKVPANTDTNLNSTSLFNVVYNPYAGLDVAGGVRVRYFGANFSKRF